MTGTREFSTAAAATSITRRRLLQSSGIAGAGLVAAPWLRGDTVRAQSATPVSSFGASAWDDLASRLSGHLLRPDDAMYPAAAIINAARYQGTRPEGIAVCASPEDAAVCVDWARENGVPFAVRSGGHSYAGFSTSNGLVIDVKGMRSVSVDPANGTVTVAGGANNADVGDVMAPYGVYFPGDGAPRWASPGSHWVGAGGSVAATSA